MMFRDQRPIPLVPLLVWSGLSLTSLIAGVLVGALLTRQLLPASAAAPVPDTPTPRATAARPAAALPTLQPPAAQATPSAAPAALPTLTLPTAVPVPSDQIALRRGEQLYRAEFSPDQTGWEAYYVSNIGANGFDRGRYVFEVADETVFYDIHPDLFVSDAVFEVDVWLLQGAGRVGLMLNFVGDPLRFNQAEFLRVTLDQLARPQVEQVRDGRAQQLPITPQVDTNVPLAQLLPDVPVRLGVVRDARGLEIYVNGTLIATANPGPPSVGRLGMTVTNAAGGRMRAEFDDLTISRSR